MAIMGGEYFERKQLRELSDFTLMKLLNLHDEIIAFEGIIPQNKVKQWFVNRGITLDSRVRYQPLSTRILPGDIQIEKALFGDYYSDSTDMCIFGPEQNGTVQKSWFGSLFSSQELLESVVFHAQFRPYLKQSLFSWASLEQFLTFLYHPLSYIKKVHMFAVNQKFIDAVKEKFADSFTVQRNTTDAQKLDNIKPPYIHCETFILLYNLELSCLDLRNILNWLLRNVRADSLCLPDLRLYNSYQDRDAVCRILINFVFGALRTCAKQELRLYSDTETNLLISLVEKFRTLPQIECEIPTIVIEAFSSRDFEEIHPNLGPNVIHRELDSQKAKFSCFFENGRNRMRISFCERADNRLTYTGDISKYDCYVKFYATEL